jgi:hypothetical protein
LEALLNVPVRADQGGHVVVGVLGDVEALEGDVNVDMDEVFSVAVRQG